MRKTTINSIFSAMAIAILLATAWPAGAQSEPDPIPGDTEVIPVPAECNGALAGPIPGPDTKGVTFCGTHGSCRYDSQRAFTVRCMQAFQSFCEPRECEMYECFAISRNGDATWVTCNAYQTPDCPDGVGCSCVVRIPDGEQLDCGCQCGSPPVIPGVPPDKEPSEAVPEN